MTDIELDRLMRNILLDAIALDAESHRDDTAFVPSPKHQHQMMAMLADPLKWARKRARPVWKRAIQRVAVILLASSLSLGSLMAVSPAVRAAVVGWVTEWYETHITYRYSGEAITGKMPQYEITALPEGYAEVESERVEWPSYTSIIYRDITSENTTVGTISFSYGYIQQGGAADQVISTEIEVLPVVINGLEGQLFMQHDWENKWSTLTWIDPNANLQFFIDAAVDKTTILHIAESVCLTKMPK